MENIESWSDWIESRNNIIDYRNRYFFIDYDLREVICGNTNNLEESDEIVHFNGIYRSLDNEHIITKYEGLLTVFNVNMEMDI